MDLYYLYCSVAFFQIFRWFCNAGKSNKKYFWREGRAGQWRTSKSLLCMLVVLVVSLSVPAITCKYRTDNYMIRACLFLFDVSMQWRGWSQLTLFFSLFLFSLFHHNGRSNHFVFLFLPGTRTKAMTGTRKSSCDGCPPCRRRGRSLKHAKRNILPETGKWPRRKPPSPSTWSLCCTCWWYSLCNFQYRQHYETTCS